MAIMRRCLDLLLFCLLPVRGVVWYSIDAPTILCTDPKTPQSILVSIPRLGGNAYHKPHIFSFYRQSNASVALTVEVTDDVSKVVLKKQTIELQKLNGTAARRLQPAEGLPEVPAAEELEEAVSVEEEEFEEEEDSVELWEGELVEEERPAPRRLSGRRRGGGGSRFSSSRYSSNTGSYSRQRSTLPDSRRRANPMSARRRGSSSPSTQPTTGVGGQRFQNSNGQAYGYTSPTALNSNFGGRIPQTTSYGYTGAGAYRPGFAGSRTTAAVVGGALIGAGLYYAYHSWSRMNSYCTYSNSWSGSCRECYNAFPTASCVMGPPRYSMNRDDLMKTGFWPADFRGPLRVTIYDVVGADFVRSSVCPPPNWNTSWSNISAGPIGLYVTLTEISELGDVLQKDGDMLPAIISTLASILCCCTFLLGGAFLLYKMKQGQQAVQVQAQMPPPYPVQGPNCSPQPGYGPYVQPAPFGPYVQPNPQAVPAPVPAFAQPYSQPYSPAYQQPPPTYQQPPPSYQQGYQPGFQHQRYQSGSVAPGAVVVGQPMGAPPRPFMPNSPSQLSYEPQPGYEPQFNYGPPGAYAPGYAPGKF